LEFLGQTQTEATPVFEDNAACICLCNSDSHESRLKHLDVHLHNARQHVARNTIALHYVSTAHQAADYLTKAITGPSMNRPNAILFGNGLDVWDKHKELSKAESRFIVPRAPIIPKNTV
jgi:hypothetical protein